MSQPDRRDGAILTSRHHAADPDDVRPPYHCMQPEFARGRCTAGSMRKEPAPLTPLQQRILDSVDALGPAEKRVARTILASYPSSAIRSASAIAKAAGSSQATVTRFVAKLGFSSLLEFHETVRSELDERFRSPFHLHQERIGANEFVESVIHSESANIAETLRRLTPDVLDDVRRILTEASEIATTGGRFTYTLAAYLATHLQMIRPGVRLVSPPGLADQLAHAGRGICLVVFDFRRYHYEAEWAAGYIKSRRGRVILVTDPYLSPAAKYADRTLVAAIESPQLVDSYAAAVALLDTIVSHLIIEDPSRTRRRIEQVEEARRQLGASGGAAAG